VDGIVHLHALLLAGLGRQAGKQVVNTSRTSLRYREHHAARKQPFLYRQIQTSLQIIGEISILSITVDFVRPQCMTVKIRRWCWIQSLRPSEEIMPTTTEDEETQTTNPIETKRRPSYDEHVEARIVKLEEFASDAKVRLVKIETRLEQTATKADLANAVERLTRYIGEVAERNAKNIGEIAERHTKEIGEVRTEIHRSIGALIRWTAGTAIGISIAAITVLTFVLNNANHQAPGQTPATTHTQPASAAKPTAK
jgi:hypothetical protein